MFEIKSYLESHSWLALPLSYSAGLIVSFTPCVYPLIPITIAYIGSKNTDSKLKAFLIAFTYVLGIALVYTFLGMVAALTGQVFGLFLQKPIVYFIIANVFLLLGLGMLDVFKIPTFSPVNLNIKAKGFVSVFLIGIISGLVVGPCTAPALGAILAYVAAKQNILLGAISLFSFALGMTTLLLVLATFANITVPKSGAWMVKIKKLFGWILIFAGEYFLIQAGKLWI